MQLDRAGSSKPGEQHLVALYDPSGKRFGHARLHASLRDHGTSMAEHLPQKLHRTNSRKRHTSNLIPSDTHYFSRKGRAGSKKVHVHYHVDSPPPRQRSSRCRDYSRAASKSRQQRYRYCSRERPVTGPTEGRGEEQASWPADANANSLSAPATPWHREAGYTDGKHRPQQDEAVMKQSAPPVSTCTSHEPANQTAPVVDRHLQCRAPQQNMLGSDTMHNCTICGSGHHFKTPATQDITAVACEMMTLVSMRTAMSEVLGNLVHKWKDVMPSSSVKG
jgi:hypothetical protein